MKPQLRDYASDAARQQGMADYQSVPAEGTDSPTDTAERNNTMEHDSIPTSPYVALDDAVRTLLAEGHTVLDICRLVNSTNHAVNRETAEKLYGPKT